MGNNVTRRGLFRNTAVGVAAVGGAAVLKPIRNAIAETPAQGLGPFFPTDIGSDLLIKGAGAPMAKGQVIRVQGIVRNEKGDALPGAVIELWQADENGKYNHPADPLQITPDENFQFWGRTVTGLSGAYSFRTIKPGSYPADANWTRPPHLHFKISLRGYYELVTQMYFEGEVLNGDDNILQNIPTTKHSEVVIPFAPTTTQSKPGVNDLLGVFDIELKRVDSSS